MKIKYHGHSCFSINSNEYTIVLDPYCGVKGFLDVDLIANEVVASHNHKDHSYVDGVSIKHATSPFKLTTIASFHDNENGKKRGLNNITVLEAENIKVVHLGDLGHILDDETVEKIKNCDVLMIPVGGYFTIDANDATKIINMVNPKNVIPMHYRDNDKGYDVLGTVDDFLKIYNKPCLLVKGYEQEIEIHSM